MNIRPLLKRLIPVILLLLWNFGCDQKTNPQCVEGECLCPEGAVEYPEFGCVESGYTDNNREYSWYLSQMGTGEAQGSNCGPTSVAMALRWYDSSQEVEVETIRETITPGDTGWWYTNHITEALAHWDTPARVLDASESSLLEALDRGNVVLICITMELVTRSLAPTTTHFNRFYEYSSGHFLIVKGYIDQGEWLIVHDPNNWEGDYYDDQPDAPLGRNRYYRTSEVLDSMAVWWPYFFEIGVPETKARTELPIGYSGPTPPSVNHYANIGVEIVTGGV